MIVDIYFRKPVLYDLVLGVVFSTAMVFLKWRNFITLPKSDIMLSVVSDLCTVALTLAGFILTLLTVLVSFKSTVKSSRDLKLDSDSLFDIFFSTSLYFDTVMHLKNAIICLSAISVSGYGLKLALPEGVYIYLFCFCCFTLVVILMTLWRCLMILSKVVELQKHAADDQ